MDKKLLDILACPECKGPLEYLKQGSVESLTCKADRLVFPVKDGVPVMLIEEARELPEDEVTD